MVWTTKEGALKHKTALLRAAKQLENKGESAKTQRMKRIYKEQADARRAIAKMIDVKIRKSR